MMAIKVLIIEDEIALRTSLKKLIQLRKYEVDEAVDIKSADKKLRYYTHDIYLLDMRLPGGSGLELLKKYKQKMEGKTIVVTAHATVSNAVEAINYGAHYYLEKPLDEDLLFIQMEKIVEISQLKEKSSFLQNEILPQPSSAQVIYKSQQMAETISLARKFAKMDNSVLIQGNTGAGKEVFAKFIHNNSKRKDKTFLPINCSSIPEQLFESELFGFKKGAFTGASDNYKGRFVQADKGTLFLDEMGEMPLHLQAKLLRVLEDGAIYQLGNDKPLKVDVRLIAATNKNLWEEVREGRFRKDLYFRLKATRIIIPPLKERKEDIIHLFKHFVSLYNKMLDKDITGITREAENFLLEYPWEGNVRELKNTVASIFSLRDSGTIILKDLMLSLHENEPEEKQSYIPLDEYIDTYIEKVYSENGFNLKKTAEILKVSRNRL
ncbi:MAG: sigma-54-dependent Fis family transcriptional regulator, partial [bacterium]|nr:sigma-54-dependent Fis family transcriptional regulator [bacterium]